MFMRICLLLLFLISNALAGNIDITYRVLNYGGILSRRADVVITCYNGTTNKSLRQNFVLKIKPQGNKIIVKVFFKGKSILLVQKIKENQILSKATLKEIDPLSGEEKVIKEIAFKNNRILINNLNADKPYYIEYSIFDDLKEKHIISPKVVLETEESKIQNTRTFQISIPIFFNTGSYNLDSKARFTLRKIKKLKGLCNVKVIGYADNTKITKSKVKSNEELANLRALSIKRFLEGEK